MTEQISINELRKKPFYRWLEASLGLSALGFLAFILVLSIFSPSLASVFIIIYSFLWLLRVALVCIYTIYSYKQMGRWSSVNWPELVDSLEVSLEKGITTLKKLRNAHKNKLDWAQKLDKDITELLKNKHTIFSHPKQIIHVPIFAVYNEPADVVLRSLKSIYDSGYPLENILVCISQEDRMGDDFNKSISKLISQENWVNTFSVKDVDLDTVYSSNHKDLTYAKDTFKKFKPAQDKLNVLITQHPDGLVGEIKGKASNEDWGARIASLYTKSANINPEQVLVTSLDADSSVGEYFFHKLSFRYCVTPDRSQAGFQPIPVYSNNYFESHVVQRLIATQTTLWQFTQNTLDGDSHFFANYSVPLIVLQEVNFWVRDIIAEDFLLYAKCLCHYNGNFRVVPFYGWFQGDAVEADDYIEALVNQYKQLQRWSWGGIESIPYMIYRFFIHPEGKNIDIRTRLQSIFNLFTNHFFWSTTPILFSIGVFLPPLFGGETFRQTQISQNLSLFSSYFAWVSLLFIVMFGFITIEFIARKSVKKLGVYEHMLILSQSIISPFVYGFMGIPALESQIKGIRGEYLGYWVTPKK